MRMDEYLRTVTEQVRCSRIHDSIAEELKDHILDQAEVFEEEGADHEQALELAVREMGDPVETGVALDRIHRPHMSVKMLVLVSLISVLSLVSYGAMLFLAGDNSINGMEYWFHQQVKYTVTGFLLMLLVFSVNGADRLQVEFSFLSCCHWLWGYRYMEESMACGLDR